MMIAFRREPACSAQRIAESALARSEHEAPCTLVVRVESGGPCELLIAVRLRPGQTGAPPVVRWEIAADRRFTAREQHGLALMERAPTPCLSLRITGLAPGRAYWYRVGRQDCAHCYIIGRLDTAAFGARGLRAASCPRPSSAIEGSVSPIRA